MRLIEAIKHQGSPFEIPDAVRDDLPAFFREMGYKTGVEIGVYKGDFTNQFCQQGLKMYGVDPWAVYEDYQTTPQYASKKWKELQDRQDFLYGHTQRTLAKYLESGQATLVRKSSMEAVKNFEDDSLDFVFIDGHHGFKYVAEDLWEWTKKVRGGGIISGHDFHDYHNPRLDPYCIHVRYVVEAYTKALRIYTWYVIGTTKKVPGERRERWRSWFWIKD